MAGILRKSHKHRASTRKNIQANRPQPTTPIGIVSVVPALSVITVTFDQPVALSGLPDYTTDIVGAEPVSAAMTSQTVMELTFDTSVALATVVNVPYEDAAVRNSSGGFVCQSAVDV